MKLTTLWPLGSLLAILACALIVLAPLPAFAYEVPPPVHRTVDVAVDINALLVVVYNPPEIYFEIGQAEWEAGSMALPSQGDLNWWTNGYWELWMWRTTWVTDIGDQGLQLSLEYWYGPNAHHKWIDFPVYPDKVLVESGPDGGHYWINDWDWKVKFPKSSVHKGNYSCTVFFELVDP